MDQNCAYCMEGELVAQFGIKICELPSSKVYLFKEQSHKGRVIVAHKKHVSEITELTAEERAAYIEDINHVAEALHKAFHPQKVNYGAYGDTGHHLHFRPVSTPLLFQRPVSRYIKQGQDKQERIDHYPPVPDHAPVFRFLISHLPRFLLT